MRRQYPGFRLGPDFAPLPGNVYYVIQTTVPFYSQFVSDYQETYRDGSQAICPHTQVVAGGVCSAVTVNGLKNALAKTVEGRNDYVIVMPADATYYIDEALAMNKKGVHMICPAGLGYDIGANNSARIQQITDGLAVIAVSDAAIEIAGLYLKNYDGHPTITLAATSYALNIHHNTFPLIWVSASPLGCIIGTGDAGAWGKIERNWFVSQSGDDQTCALGVIQIQGSATACQVNHNQITIGDGNIATIGISNAAVKGHTDFNVFSECGGNDVASGGTITKCISIAATGCAIGNLAAVLAGELLDGGTSAHRAVANYEAAATTAIL
jgi:hypothetical protein